MPASFWILLSFQGAFFQKKHNVWPHQDSNLAQKSRPENTNLKGSITIWLTSSLFCLEPTALLCLYWIKISMIELASDLLVWLNPNQSNRRSALQWYFPLWWVFFEQTIRPPRRPNWSYFEESILYSLFEATKEEASLPQDCCWQNLHHSHRYLINRIDQTFYSSVVKVA